MKLYWYVSSNFGDCLNQWLWPKTFKTPLSSLFKPNDLFFGIGTILSEAIPASTCRKIVFGSGMGYGMPPYISDLWRIYAVRGPLTARFLGLNPKLAITDPAILCSNYITPATHRKCISFIPHHLNPELNTWKLICSQLDIQYVDPTGDIDTTISAINSSSLVIAEAMHGAIISDSLRIPWIPVKASNHFNQFKWQDWAQSMNIPLAINSLPTIQSTGKRGHFLPFQIFNVKQRFKAIANSKPFLSSRASFEVRLEQMSLMSERILEDARNEKS